MAWNGRPPGGLAGAGGLSDRQGDRGPFTLAVVGLADDVFPRLGPNEALCITEAAARRPTDRSRAAAGIGQEHALADGGAGDCFRLKRWSARDRIGDVSATRVLVDLAIVFVAERRPPAAVVRNSVVAMGSFDV
jgi:hypothetical protein